MENCKDMLLAQKDKLIQKALYSVNPCTIATAIALSDEQVIEKFIEKVNAGDVFKGHRCLNHTTDWEKVYVYFDFDCPPGVFCIVKPSFAAVVNLVSRKVEVIDPFDINEINELQKVIQHSNLELNNFLPNWPDIDDIEVKVFLEGTEIVLTASYKGSEKYRTVLADVGDAVCGNRGDIDLFTASGCKVYLRYVWLCIKPDQRIAEYSFQVWARVGSLKTKLSDTIEGDISW